jgi:hypothetical protein
LASWQTPDEVIMLQFSIMLALINRCPEYSSDATVVVELTEASRMGTQNQHQWEDIRMWLAVEKKGAGPKKKKKKERRICSGAGNRTQVPTVKALYPKPLDDTGFLRLLHNGTCLPRRRETHMKGGCIRFHSNQFTVEVLPSLTSWARLASNHIKGEGARERTITHQ